MKKNYIFILLAFCFCSITFGQVTLPHYESFDYNTGEDLDNQVNWENFSGTTNPIDVVAGSLTYSGLETSTGNSINIVGGAMDSRILFDEVTSGDVYASFLLKVTDISSMTDLTDGGYFAVFGSTTNSFKTRLWVHPATDPVGSTYNIAYTNSSTGSGFGDDYNVNDIILVVMSYNVDTGVLNTWINPDTSTFEAGSAPTADLTNTDASPSTIDRFILRQDSTGETPDMLFDELRIGTTWASVTPTGSISSDPTITINAPSNNASYESTTTEVPVTLTVSNFNFSGDNGSGMSDNTGDGYIKATLETQGGTTETFSYFSTTVPAIQVTPGSTYTLTTELVDNNGLSLSTITEASTTFSVSLPCDLELGTIETNCDSQTSSIDTYNGSIPFTGGNTGITYTITAPSGVTIAGDDPNTMTEGTITFSGMTEGVDAEIIILGGSGSSCDYTRTLLSPTCISFPIIEHFDYTDGAILSDQTNWTIANSGDDILISTGNLDYDGLENSTGNKISFDGSGAECSLDFSDITSGAVYTSFLLKVTAFQDGTTPDLTDGGYFAILGNYDVRAWIRPNPDTAGTTFDIGYGSETSNPTFTSGTYNLNDTIFIIISYNIDNGETNLWVNPDVSSFEGTIPTATISGIDSEPVSLINTFILRQDSTNETPFIEMDAIRIATSWAEVTPKDATASVIENQIEGFAAYPNPTKNNLTISSSSSNAKEITIFNVIGKKVFEKELIGTKTTLDVSSINSGIYILKVTEEGKTATKKLVIQ